MEEPSFFAHLFTVWGMIITAIVCSMIGTAVAVIAKQWRKARVAELETGLKSELIKQGRSADEIQRILEAGTRPATDEE